MKVRNKVIASRYAKAVFSLANKDDLDKFAADIDVLVAFFQNHSQLVQSLNSSVFSFAKKKEFVVDLSEQTSCNKLWFNFLLLLVKKHRFVLVLDILAELQEIVLDYLKKEEVRVVLARQHSDGLINEIGEAIKQKIGKEPNITVSIDESIIGGFVVHTKKFIVDCSIKNSLGRLAAQ